MKRIYLSILGVVVAYAVILLAQLWFTLFPWDIFIKISITVGVLLLVAGAVVIIRKTISEETDLKKDKYLN